MALKIELEFSDQQLKDFQVVFPELDPEIAAKAVASHATSEMLELFSGRKRYLSLSHQYIEWLESLNADLLPQTEFSPARLMNCFHFPPGSAAYISRVLRDRQNTVLVQQATQGLLNKLQEVESQHGAYLSNGKNSLTNHSIVLAKREYHQLKVLLDEWEAKQLELSPEERNPINYPKVSENRMNFVKVHCTLSEVRKILAAIES